MSDQERVAYWRQFGSCGLPVVVYTQLQTKKGRSPLAARLSGMCSIFIRRIVLAMCDRGDESEDEERKKMNKIGIFMFGFLDLDKR